MLNANVAQQQNQSQNASCLTFLFNAPADGTANGAIQPQHNHQQFGMVHQQHSVIVHTQQQRQMANAAEEATENNEQKRARKRRGRKRKKREGDEDKQKSDEEEEEGEADGEGNEQRQSGHGSTHATGPSPRAIGVRRFISPFEDTVKIPLPHELEMSTQGTTVWKRNERERQRVQLLNSGFTQLRQRLPLIDCDRRMSKVDSLRLAIAYIRHLQLLLQHSNGHWAECNCFKQSYGGGDGRSSGAESTPPPN